VVCIHCIVNLVWAYIYIYKYIYMCVYVYISRDRDKVNSVAACNRKVQNEQSVGESKWKRRKLPRAFSKRKNARVSLRSWFEIDMWIIDNIAFHYVLHSIAYQVPESHEIILMYSSSPTATYYYFILFRVLKARTGWEKRRRTRTSKKPFVQNLSHVYPKHTESSSFTLCNM